MQNPVVWFEIMSPAADTLRGFYRDLFHWEINTDNPTGYGMVNTGSETGIQGGIAQADGAEAQWVTVYIAVDDISRYLAAIAERGGTVVVPRTVAPDVTFALFCDPAGNRIGLVERAPA
ncbi:MAG: hypothetical protein KC609_01990 [Myxococcales bacterium]|nr:hypothetical protein [Myxococcales bacterium]